MNDNEFIKRFVNFHEIEKNRFSCLMEALIDARKLTARNIKTGKFEGNILENENSFLNPYAFIGVINYLLILDMIGEIFTIKNNKPKIYWALNQYSQLKSDKDKYTLVALRNSLAHNYGLINIPDEPKHYFMSRHKFQLVNSESFQLIEYPIKPWDGDFEDKSDDTSTKIGQGKLFELIETVHQSLKCEVEFNSIKNFGLKGGIEELKARFTIMH